PLPATWECAPSERRLCRGDDSWGEVSEGGRRPPPSFVGALGRTLNVQRVRLACGPRAPPCSWTLLIALARAVLRQAPRAGAEKGPSQTRKGQALERRSVLGGTYRRVGRP